MCAPLSSPEVPLTLAIHIFRACPSPPLKPNLLLLFKFKVQPWETYQRTRAYTTRNTYRVTQGRAVLFQLQGGGGLSYLDNGEALKVTLKN